MSRNTNNIYTIAKSGDAIFQALYFPAYDLVNLSIFGKMVIYSRIVLKGERKFSSEQKSKLHFALHWWLKSVVRCKTPALTENKVEMYFLVCPSLSLSVCLSFWGQFRDRLALTVRVNHTTWTGEKLRKSKTWERERERERERKKMVEGRERKEGGRGGICPQACVCLWPTESGAVDTEMRERSQMSDGRKNRENIRNWDTIRQRSFFCALIFILHAIYMSVKSCFLLRKS